MSMKFRLWSIAKSMLMVKTMIAGHHFIWSVLDLTSVFELWKQLFFKPFTLDDGFHINCFPQFIYISNMDGPYNRPGYYVRTNISEVKAVATILQACRNGSVHVVELLLRSKADVNKKDRWNLIEYLLTAKQNSYFNRQDASRVWLNLLLNNSLW